MKKKALYIVLSVLILSLLMSFIDGFIKPPYLIKSVVKIVLFLGGLIFNYLNEKCKNIYPSWLVHMCANFATNTIGFILFGIF